MTQVDLLKAITQYVSTQHKSIEITLPNDTYNRHVLWHYLHTVNFHYDLNHSDKTITLNISPK